MVTSSLESSIINYLAISILGVVVTFIHSALLYLNPEVWYCVMSMIFSAALTLASITTVVNLCTKLKKQNRI